MTGGHQISVPFVWEERPGIPNKDWKPAKRKPSNTPKFVPPDQLIPSIPFQWEDKPGTPLSSIQVQPQSKGNFVIIMSKPLLTLEELMTMSRRRSYQRKAQMQIQSVHMKQKLTGSALGCCVLGVRRRIEELHTKWKRELKLFSK
ncbi:unnamed protein product [Cuscuta europaea]|uniref:Uncharacterized protein n=1 Tax=Cuscuta europaea TaxID=41803 RepID=A0A9P1EEA9_CUSEU|nr:unnamed protein product [Cuscuta europaea]